MPNDFHLPVIEPLVARHSGDAAFYWGQLDGAARVNNIDFARLAHFESLLEAHLDGLKVAGSAGWQSVFAALQRWKKVGETFAATWLAVQNGQASEAAEVVAFIDQRPDELLRGAISALARSEWTTVRPTLQTWSKQSAEAAAQVAALRAATLIGAHAIEELSAPLSDYAKADSAHIRAAAMRASAWECSKLAVAPYLRAALDDADHAVRAEAAIVLVQFETNESAAVVLADCIKAQSALCATARGADRRIQARRLMRWVRKLALYTPAESHLVQSTLAILSARAALTFILCHGNLAHTPFVVEQMANPEVRRHAGWVWQTLTGIDLAATGLTVQEAATNPASANPQFAEDRLDGDNGLALPCVTSIQAVMRAKPELARQTERILLGRELDVSMASQLLKTAPQAVRQLAADAIRRTWPSIRINIQASASEQLQVMEELDQLLASGTIA